MFLCLESAQRVKLFIYLFIFSLSRIQWCVESAIFFSKILHFPGFHCPQSSKFVFFWNCSLSRTPSCSESAKLIFSILPFLGFHRARGCQIWSFRLFRLLPSPTKCHVHCSCLFLQQLQSGHVLQILANFYSDCQVHCFFPTWLGCSSLCLCSK